MLRGSLVALITPMLEDGAIDWAALKRLIDWHLEQGTHGIVPVGTTGESATLAVAEHLEVVARTVEWVGGRVPVVAGTGANATAEAIHLTSQAQQAGADACLSVTPYYNRPTQEGLYRHFMAIADSTSLPVVLYNVPPRTACDLLPETVERLATHERIIAIKEACGDAERVAALKERVPDSFIILSGEDAQTLRMMELGALGTISVTANVLPQRWLVQLILFGPETTVQRLELNEDQTGEWVVPLDRRTDRAVISISGLAPVTTEMGSYEYEFEVQ